MMTLPELRFAKNAKINAASRVNLTFRSCGWNPSSKRIGQSWVITGIIPVFMRNSCNKRTPVFSRLVGIASRWLEKQCLWLQLMIISSEQDDVAMPLLGVSYVSYHQNEKNMNFLILQICQIRKGNVSNRTRWMYHSAVAACSYLTCSEKLCQDIFQTGVLRGRENAHAIFYKDSCTVVTIGRNTLHKWRHSIHSVEITNVSSNLVISARSLCLRCSGWTGVSHSSVQLGQPCMRWSWVRRSMNCLLFFCRLLSHISLDGKNNSKNILRKILDFRKIRHISHQLLQALNFFTCSQVPKPETNPAYNGRRTVHLFL